MRAGAVDFSGFRKEKHARVGMACLSVLAQSGQKVDIFVRKMAVVNDEQFVFFCERAKVVVERVCVCVCVHVRVM